MSGRQAPKPENFEAMAAAVNDPVEYAKQVAIYNQQLMRDGYAPVYEVIDPSMERRPIDD